MGEAPHSRAAAKLLASAFTQADPEEFRLDVATETPDLTGPPVFLVCVPRTGSTLLARLLNAHPEMACPSETMLEESFSAIERTSQMVSPDEASGVALANELIRHLADHTLGAYARRMGKVRWCDKSLTVVDNLDRISRVFPQAQFICLYREVSDTVASALEASPWGWSAFGYEPYVRQNLGNLVSALSAHWADKVDIALRLEKAHPERCHRVLYEALVTDPASVLPPLFSFLKLPWDEAIMEQEGVFGRRKMEWAGDHKIRYTQDFDASSIGRGWNMPMDFIDRPVRDRIRRISRQLGYPPPGEDMPSVLDALKVRFKRLKDLPSVSALMKRRLDALSPLFAERVTARLADGSWATGRLKLPGAVKLVLADVISDGAGEWIIDFSAGRIERPDHPFSFTVLTDSETLLDLANGHSNPGIALRLGKLQVWSNTLSSPERLLDRLDAVVRLFLPVGSA